MPGSGPLVLVFVLGGRWAVSLGLSLSGGGGGLVEGVVSASDIAWGTALGAEGGGGKNVQKEGISKKQNNQRLDLVELTVFGHFFFVLSKSEHPEYTGIQTEIFGEFVAPAPPSLQGG